MRLLFVRNYNTFDAVACTVLGHVLNSAFETSDLRLWFIVLTGLIACAVVSRLAERHYHV